MFKSAYKLTFVLLKTTTGYKTKHKIKCNMLISLHINYLLPECWEAKKNAASRYGLLKSSELGEDLLAFDIAAAKACSRDNISRDAS